MGTRSLRRWGLAWGAIALLAGPLAACRDPEPFPYGITKLGVLPAWSPLGTPGAAATWGEQLSASLVRRTSFRVVGAGSAQAYLSQPEHQGLAQGLRTEVLALGQPSVASARAIGRHLNVQAILTSVVSVRDFGLQGGGGEVALQVSAFETESGARIWGWVGQQRYGDRPTRAQALGLAVSQLVDRAVSALPRPAGEAPEPKAS